MITGMPRIAIASSDFEGLLETFRDRLGMPVIDISESTVASLGAKLAMCVPEGGSNIELMSPADPSAPLSMSLQRFLDRRGEGLFALMLEAPDPDAEAEVLIERGLNVLPLMPGATGRDIHPNSAHGVLIRIYPVNSFQAGDLPVRSGESAGLSGIQWALLAVKDLDAAINTFRVGFGMEVDDPEQNLEHGVRYAIVHPPSGGVICLLSVTDEGAVHGAEVADFLKTRGEGLFGLLLESAGPEVGEVLERRGLVAGPYAGYPELTELNAHGTRILISPFRDTD